MVPLGLMDHPKLKTQTRTDPIPSPYNCLHMDGWEQGFLSPSSICEERRK